jgi:hypothetical protein
LAVALTAEEHADQIRLAMRGLLLRGQRKVHWRDEGAQRRSAITALIAGLPIDALIVVRQGSATERPERRRRKCMERLLWELDGCDQLILESRGAKDDARDQQMIHALRRRHAVPRGLRTFHSAGPTDPALWAADALCGAVVQARSQDQTHLNTIRAGIPVRLIEL